jgi:arylsulfatase A-like enzyme
MGMVAALDEQVGRIADALKAQGIEGNTLVLFSSDNGGPSPGTITRNGDLRAGKGTLYEGGVRVCASATWPGVIAPGSTLAQPVHIVDWYATALTLAGASLEQPKPIDGRDLMPALKGDAKPVHDEVLINVAPNSGAIRAGDWKLVVNGFRQIAEEAADPEATTRRSTDLELFDLKSDRSEKRNLAADHPDVVARLKARYDELLTTAAPAFGEAKDPQFRSPKVWGEFE